MFFGSQFQKKRETTVFNVGKTRPLSTDDRTGPFSSRFATPPLLLWDSSSESDRSSNSEENGLDASFDDIFESSFFLGDASDVNILPPSAWGKMANMTQVNAKKVSLRRSVLNSRPTTTIKVAGKTYNLGQIGESAAALIQFYEDEYFDRSSLVFSTSQEIEMGKYFSITNRKEIPDWTAFNSKYMKDKKLPYMEKIDNQTLYFQTKDTWKDYLQRASSSADIVDAVVEIIQNTETVLLKEQKKIPKRVFPSEGGDQEKSTDKPDSGSSFLYPKYDEYQTDAISISDLMRTILSVNDVDFNIELSINTFNLFSDQYLNLQALEASRGKNGMLYELRVIWLIELLDLLLSYWCIIYKTLPLPEEDYPRTNSSSFTKRWYTGDAISYREQCYVELYGLYRSLSNYLHKDDSNYVGSLSEAVPQNSISFVQTYMDIIRKDIQQVWDNDNRNSEKSITSILKLINFDVYKSDSLTQFLKHGRLLSFYYVESFKLLWLAPRTQRKYFDYIRVCFLSQISEFRKHGLTIFLGLLETTVKKLYSFAKIVEKIGKDQVEDVSRKHKAELVSAMFKIDALIAYLTLCSRTFGRENIYLDTTAYPRFFEDFGETIEKNFLIQNYIRANEFIYKILEEKNSITVGNVKNVQDALGSASLRSERVWEMNDNVIDKIVSWSRKLFQEPTDDTWIAYNCLKLLGRVLTRTTYYEYMDSDFFEIDWPESAEVNEIPSVISFHFTLLKKNRGGYHDIRFVPQLFYPSPSSPLMIACRSKTDFCELLSLYDRIIGKILNSSHIVKIDYDFFSKVEENAGNREGVLAIYIKIILPITVALLFQYAKFLTLMYEYYVLGIEMEDNPTKYFNEFISKIAVELDDESWTSNPWESIAVYTKKAVSDRKSQISKQTADEMVLMVSKSLEIALGARMSFEKQKRNSLVDVELRTMSQKIVNIGGNVKKFKGELQESIEISLQGLVDNMNAYQFAQVLLEGFGYIYNESESFRDSAVAYHTLIYLKYISFLSDEKLILGTLSKRTYEPTYSASSQRVPSNISLGSEKNSAGQTGKKSSKASLDAQSLATSQKTETTVQPPSPTGGGAALAASQTETAAVPSFPNAGEGEGEGEGKGEKDIGKKLDPLPQRQAVYVMDLY
jgi:hypothetical protein